MPLRAVDIKVGQWLIISETEEPPTRSIWGPSRQSYDGFPFKVKATSLPFICVQLFHGATVTIDTRLHGFVKARPEYVNAMIDNVDGHPDADLERRQKPLRRRRRRELQPAGQEVIDPRACNRCGSRCVQRMMSNVHTGERGWFYYCENCNHLKGPVPQ